MFICGGNITLGAKLKLVSMNKNKIIGLVIWFVTLVVPMKDWMFAEVGGSTSTTMYLVMFLLTLTGVFVGSYFFSKSTDSKVA